MNPQNQTPQPIHPTPPQTSAQQAPAAAPEPSHPLDRTEKFRRLFYQVLIGCLLASAAVAVVAVLAGGFNHTLGRALATLAMVALHAALSFGYITETENQNKKDGGRSIELFTNTVFTLIVVSFITSQFAIWEVLSGSITVKLYMLYGVLLFATLHADVLYRIRRFEKRIDAIVAANYFTMAIVVLMLAMVIFASSLSDLDPFYFRLLAAIAIVDATMTITAVIMQKMFFQNHPQLAAKVAKADVTAAKKNFWQHPIVIILMILLGFQVVVSLIGALTRGF